MKPIDWKQIAGKTGYFIIGNCLITTYMLNDKEVVFIDSGLKDTPEMIDFFRDRGISVRAVIISHMHIDHIGNANLLYNAFETETIATEYEFEYKRIRHYLDNIVFRKCRVIPTDGSEFTIDDATFKYSPIPGHSPDHIMIITPDNVCCLGDALLGNMNLRFAKFPYVCDQKTYMESMDVIEKTNYPFYTLAHAEVFAGNELSEYIQKNRDFEEKILKWLGESHARNNPEGSREIDDKDLVWDIMVELGTDAYEKNPFTRSWMNETAITKLKYLKDKKLI